MNTVEKYLIYNTSMVEKIQPVVIPRAKRATITDTEGKDYIDCFSGITLINVGHCTVMSG